VIEVTSLFLGMEETDGERQAARRIANVQRPTPTKNSSKMIPKGTPSSHSRIRPITTSLLSGLLVVQG
jgi:hypothetical protein